LGHTHTHTAVKPLPLLPKHTILISLRINKNDGLTLTSWNPLGHSRPVTGLLYLFFNNIYLRAPHNSVLSNTTSLQLLNHLKQNNLQYDLLNKKRVVFYSKNVFMGFGMKNSTKSDKLLKQDKPI
jgi:hypothetical protein